MVRTQCPGLAVEDLGSASPCHESAGPFQPVPLGELETGARWTCRFSCNTFPEGDKGRA